MLGEVKSLSLTRVGSLTNAALGAVSGVVFEVTQRGVGPVAFEATQPDGNAGAVTPSKFCDKAVPVHGVPVWCWGRRWSRCRRWCPVGVGVGVGVPVGVGVGVPVGPGVGVGPHGPPVNDNRVDAPSVAVHARVRAHAETQLDRLPNNIRSEIGDGVDVAIGTLAPRHSAPQSGWQTRCRSPRRNRR